MNLNARLKLWYTGGKEGAEQMRWRTLWRLEHLTEPERLLLMTLVAHDNKPMTEEQINSYIWAKHGCPRCGAKNPALEGL